MAEKQCEQVGKSVLASVAKSGRVDLLMMAIVDVTAARLRIAQAIADEEFNLSLMYGDGSATEPLGVLEVHTERRA